MSSHAFAEVLREGRPGLAPGRESGAPLRVAVVATTEAGTRAALGAARTLGAGLGPDVTLVILRVVPHLQPILFPPAAAIRSLAAWYRQMAGECGLDVSVRFYVCRPDGPDLARAMAGGGVVLIGGKSRRWWPTREQRLATRLGTNGNRVLFIDTARTSKARLLGRREAAPGQGVLQRTQAFLARRRERPLLSQREGQ